MSEETKTKNAVEEVAKKIVRPILIIRDAFKNLDLDFEKIRFPRKALKRFIEFIEEVTDTRVKGMIKYTLSYIVLLAFLAVCANSSTWVDIEEFGKQKRKMLKRWLPKYQGIPSHDTFQRVFGKIDPAQLCEAVSAFLLQELDAMKNALNIKEEGYRLINADGKEAKGTGRKYGTDEKISNQQTLNIYDASNAVVLGSIPIDTKTNEIPTLQDFLKQKEIDLKDCIVTFDAMNTQKETIRVICSQNGDYVGGLKGNQQLFSEEVKSYFDDKTLAQIRQDKVNYRFCIEKAHNKIEKRRYYFSTDVKWFTNPDKWTNLRSVICYESETEDLVTGKKTFERRYYISSLTNVDVCVDAIRGHWSIENQLHWHLDVSFGEDRNSTTDKNAFNNLSIINKISLTLFKLIQPIMGIGLEAIRKCVVWNLEGMLSLLLCLFDESVLKEAMKVQRQA